MLKREEALSISALSFRLTIFTNLHSPYLISHWILGDFIIFAQR